MYARQLKSMLGMWVLLAVLIVLASGSHAATYSGGMGTAAEPYRIASILDWTTLYGATADWNKNFILVADIDFADALIMPIAPDASGDPGFQGPPFTGVFDGNGHVLRNARISMADSDYVGLFGFIGMHGEVFDLTLESVRVTGDEYCGILAGQIHVATITGCYATGVVECFEGDNIGGLVGACSFGTLMRCYTAVEVDGYRHVGGLLGFNQVGLVESCCATGSVYGEDWIGGLVGTNEGDVSSSCATGNAHGEDNVGGLAGGNTDTIVSCYARGDASGEESRIGGLVGYNNSGTITACYATGEAASSEEEEDVGGLVGLNEAGTISDNSYWDLESSGITFSDGGAARTTDQMTYPYAADTYAGWDTVYIWAADTDYSVNDGYPYLRNCAYPREEEGGCCRGPGKNLALQELIQKTLGDWLLVGLCVLTLAVFSAARK